MKGIVVCLGRNRNGERGAGSGEGRIQIAKDGRRTKSEIGFVDVWMGSALRQDASTPAKRPIVHIHAGGRLPRFVRVSEEDTALDPRG